MAKILVVEDEKKLLEMYVARLEKAGYDVVGVLTGQEGLEKAQQEKPDLIVLDILMPGLTGYDVLKKLKVNSRTKDIKVLVFSNLGQDEEIKKGLDLGANDYIIKTNYTPKDLLDKIEKILKEI